PHGASWRWRKGTNEVSHPTTAWRQPGFNDSAWLTGAMPFYYGLGGIMGGTVLSDMRYNYTTVYLRRTFMVGTQLGAVNPADIFIPILIATYFATIAGLISVAIIQKIKLFDKVILAYLGGLTAIIAGIIYYFSTLPKEQITEISTFTANFILLSIIMLFIVLALIKKVNVYDAFIEGAKEGFGIAVKIIPFLVAILVAIGIFRASGAMDFLIGGMAQFFAWLGFDTEFTGALPVAFMKPLSGSGARGLMIDAMTTHGADSFIGRLACTLQGATDTTFYIIAVYFGSVGIKNTRHAVGCGLIADLAGAIAAIFIAYLFFN
ncbi:MAG: spore maturation protein, partial [Bacteroidales bacterium]